MTSGRSFLHAAWLVFVAAVVGLAIFVAASPEALVDARIAAGALAAFGLPYLVGSAIDALRSREFRVSAAIVVGMLFGFPAFFALVDRWGACPTSELVHAFAAPVFFVGFSAPRVRGRLQFPGWLLPSMVAAWALALAVAFTHVPGGEPRTPVLVTTLHVAYACGLGAAYLREGRRWSAVIVFVLFGTAAAAGPSELDRSTMPLAMFTAMAIRYFTERAETRRRASITPQEAR